MTGRTVNRFAAGGAMEARETLPLTCSHWGTYRVESRNGRVVALHDFEHDPDPSPIGHGMVEPLYDRNRITEPMIRKSWLEHGPGSGNELRGRDPFVEVDWETAEDLVAAELDRVRSELGNNAIFGGTYGWASAGRFHHAPSQLRRFLNCIGGSVTRKNSYSLAAAEVLMPHVMAPFFKLLDESTSWSSIISHTGLFVAFGGIPVRNSQINAGGVACHGVRSNLEDCHDRGMRFVNASPIASDVPDEINCEWLSLRPGTDTALMLAISHWLIVNNRCNREFIANCTTGFEQLSDYILGNTDGVAKSPVWASSICDIPVDRIDSLAGRMAATRTMISVSWSLTRQHHGEQPYWAAVALAALLGQIGLPGGGIGFGYGAVNMVGEGADIIPAMSFPMDRNPVREFIPVARITDMLLNPGKGYDYNGMRLEYPDIDLIYWAGGNPFHHHQDLNRMLVAWRKPSTIIVNEWCWNTMAKHADIILPCTTAVERNDIAIARSPFIISMTRAALAPGSARDDHDIFSSLARKLGVHEQFTSGLTKDEWVEYIYVETRKRAETRGMELPDYDTIRRIGWHEIDPPSSERILLEQFRNDPEGNPLPTPSGRIELYSETIAGFGYEDCVGHPCWFEPNEWLGNASDRYPLHLISSQPATKLHSQFDNGPVSKSLKVDGREPVFLHIDDARDRGIASGDTVRVFNQRGTCYASAVIKNTLRRSVVQMSTGAWLDQEYPGIPGSACKHGNPNILTRDQGTSSLAQGPTAHTCLVNVEKADGPLPEVTAFEPPVILRGHSSAVRNY